MVELLGDAVRDVVVVAAREARAAAHASIGVEHLLIGVLRVQHELAAQALYSYGLEPDRVRAGLVELAGGGEQQTAGGTIVFDKRSRGVLVRALATARAAGRDRIGTDDLLLALDRGEKRGVVSSRGGFRAPSANARDDALDVMLRRGDVEKSAQPLTIESWDALWARWLELCRREDTVAEDEADVVSAAAELRRDVEARMRPYGLDIDPWSCIRQDVCQAICQAIMSAMRDNGGPEGGVREPRRPTPNTGAGAAGLSYPDLRDERAEAKRPPVRWSFGDRASAQDVAE